VFEPGSEALLAAADGGPAGDAAGRPKMLGVLA
jgi:hypothetical protein